jgi:hypothetical protein
MHAPKGLGRAGHRAEILEPLGVHRRSAVDEAGQHQSIALIEEQDLSIDTRFGGDTRRHGLMPAIDVLAGALAGDAQYKPLVAGRDLVVTVGESGEPFDLDLIRCDPAEPWNPGQRGAYFLKVLHLFDALKRSFAG